MDWIFQKVDNSEITNKGLEITQRLFFDYEYWFENIADDVIMAKILFNSGLFEISKFMLEDVFVKIFKRILDIWEFDGSIDGYFEIVEAIFGHGNAIITVKTHNDDPDILCGELRINVQADTTGIFDLEVSNNGYEYEPLQVTADGVNYENLQVQGQSFLSNYKNYIGAIETYTPAGIHLVYTFQEAA